jgi:hypothetical protein
MPLLDHFHPPLTPARNRESFHALWSGVLVERLNRVVLPEGYFAETQVHIGGRVEVDVASFEDSSTRPTEATSCNGGVAVAPWAPPAVALRMPTIFPDEIEVQVFRDLGGTSLVGAVELVSPGNKDRPEARRSFAAKCAAYLQKGIGLVVVDIVTERRANLHDELVDLLRQPDSFRFPGGGALYTVAYRPTRTAPEDDGIDLWFEALELGRGLPTMPLALRGGPTLPVELETTYTETRLRGRL